VIYRSGLEATEGTYSVWFYEANSLSQGFEIFIQSDPDPNKITGSRNYCLVLEAADAPNPMFGLSRRENDVQGWVRTKPPQFVRNEWVRAFIIRKLPDTVIAGYERSNGFRDSVVYVDPNPLLLPGKFVLFGCGNSAADSWMLDDVCFTACDVPAFPPHPTVTSVCDSISISWAPVSDATSYGIYRDGTLSAIQSGTAWTDSTPGANQHCYTVTAQNSCGESQLSLPICATVQLTPLAPTAPTVVTSIGSRRIGWGAVAGADAYCVYRDGVQMACQAGTTWTDINPGKGLHCYQVTAQNACGISPQSFETCVIIDSDADGVSDSLDNCPSVANQDQVDSDTNGVGDACCCVGERGNVNQKGKVDLSDLSTLILYLLGGEVALPCPSAANVDGIGAIDLSDLSALISYIIGSGYKLQNCHYSVPITTTIINQDSSDAIVVYDTISGLLSVDLSSISEQDVSVGNIIVGQNLSTAPNGFLRKVTSKSLNGNLATLGTSQATITEAFKSISINESVALRPSDVRSAKLLGNSKFKAEPGDVAFVVELDCVLHDEDGDLETEGDQTKLTGEYSFAPTLLVEIQQELFTLKAFEISLKTDESATISFSFGNESNIVDEEVELGRFHLSAIPVGGIVWLVPTIVVKAHLSGDLTVTLETSVTFTQQLRYGFGYADGIYYSVSEAEKGFIYSPPVITAELSVEPAISLNVACLVYGIAGPYFGGKLGISFQSSLSSDPCDPNLNFGVDATLYAVTGAECQILDLDHSEDYELYTYPICDWSYPLVQLGTIVVNPEPNSIGAPWSIAGPCGYVSSGNGDAVVTDLYPGQYSVTWGGVAGWTSPSSATQTLASGQTLTFTGTYVSALDVEAPTVPTGVNCSAVSATQINISWNASTDNVGVTGYKVYREGTYWKTVTGTSTTDPGLSCNVSHCYTVSAFDAANNESAQSAQSCCNTNQGGDCQAPSVPTGVTCTPVSMSQINLSWNASTDNVGVSVYLIYRNGALLTSTSALNYPDNSLSCNTQYCYQVSAQDAAQNESARSSQSCCTTLPCPPAPQPQVQSPNGGETLILGGSYTITWTNLNVGSVYNYVKIEVSNDGGSNSWSQLAYYASSTATSWVWNPINYYCTNMGRIRVTLTGPYGNGSDVSNANFDIKYPTPSFVAPADNATSVTTSTPFSWTAVSGALNYTFQVSNNSNFTSPQIASKTVNGTTSTTLSGPWDNTNLSLVTGNYYYWRVAVYDNRFGCPSNWSTPPRRFRYGN
jgi:chitodextrinase